MEIATTKPDDAGGLVATLGHVGAVTVRRGGRPVAAYYSSVAAELAVCRGSVGLAVRPDLSALDLFGHPPGLEGFLASRLGERVPAVGSAERVAGVWCARVDPGGAYLIGPHSAVDRWRRLTREAIVVGGLIASGSSTGHVVVSLIGPRVGKLLHATGLPGDAPLRSVSTCSLAGGSTVLLREGPDRALLLLEPDRADDGCSAILSAGRGLGLSPVGADAVARLVACRGAPAG